jgi:hypothetical protein
MYQMQNMTPKFLLPLILACLPVAHADVPAAAIALQPAQDRAKIAAELDAITTETVAKFNAQAPAADFDPLLTRISKLQLATFRGPASGDPDALRAYGLQQFIAEWQDYLLQKDKAPEAANSSLQQLVSLASTFPIVPRTALMALMINPEDMQASRQKKANDLTAGLTAKVVAALDTAKKPCDLDPVFAELANASNNRNDYGNSSGKIQNLKHFVQNWQDYLAALAAGRISDAHNDLKGLENANYDTSFYPRSKILAAMDSLPPAPPPPMLSLDRPEMLTLDNLDEFLGQLAALRNNPAFAAMNEGGVEQSAVNIKDAYAQVKAGRGKEVLGNPMMNFNPYGTGRYAEALTELWSRVRLLAAPDAIEAPATAKPTDKDTLSTYFERTLVGAISAKDWDLATRVLKTEQVVIPQVSGDAADDLVGIRALVIGGHHEVAGQWAEAVACYTGALNSTGSHLPVTELSHRLHLIQKSHPDDYAAGIKLPDPSRSQGNPFMSRGNPNIATFPNGQPIPGR